MMVRYFDYEDGRAWYYVTAVNAPEQPWPEKIIIALEEEFTWNRYWTQKEYSRTVAGRMN